jgi:hypothetical protein
VLDLSRPAGSPAKGLKVIELNNDGGEAKRLIEEANRSVRRSVYLPLVRGIVPTSLAVFDFAEQGMVTGSRDVTTVAPQALYLLNDPFVRRQALTIAQRLLSRADLDDAGRLAAAGRLTIGRAPTPREVERATAFLSAYEEAFREANGAAGGSPTEDEAKKSETSADGRLVAWASYCQALLGSGEYRYLR